MNPLEYRYDYCDDPRLRAAFNDFLLEIHGLDLNPWDERVGWDPDFVSFSFFDRDRIVASTSVYVMDVIVRGEWRRVAQLSSVGTARAYRRCGLNAELTRRAMDWVADHAPGGTFFFADDDAVGFYAKQGFVEKAEWRSVVAAPAGPPAPDFRRLKYDADEALIVRLVEGRAPVSEVFGVRSPKLELFHLLYENAGELRYVPDLDTLVACEVENATLMVYDVIAPQVPTWAELGPRVADAGVQSVSFGFVPDRLAVADAVAVEDRGSRMHVVPGEDLMTGQVMVPATAHA